MPKIVDKVDKRKKIAKSTCDLFIEKGFVNISISEIAKVAGIGKGTIYEYFKNKEDIVFELMSCLQEDYDPRLEENLQKSSTVKDKVISLFDLFLSENEKVKTQRKIYREFLAIYLNNPSSDIDSYHTQIKQKYANVLTGILNEAIEAKEIKKESLLFLPSIFATVEGFFLINDNNQKILEYFDNLFELLKYEEIKK
ncbi:MAG: TetR/AcrR family transcriptional regulator [Campylobacterota bacterium]|nr:TetR/AcrR family transcriptional regulator [Campylobacterota bacterium]